MEIANTDLEKIILFEINLQINIFFFENYIFLLLIL